MGSIDLKDAYFVIPIFEEHRKFLRFKFKGKIFQFSCLPFGLCTSPYVFTKIMKPIVNKLRLRGILLILYLDDFLFIHKSKEICKKIMREVIELLQYLGFIVNYEKSSLTAKQQCKYLGFIIDSVEFSLKLTDKKKKQVLKLSNEFKVGKEYKIRKFAEFLGTLTSVCPAVAYGFVHCKSLERSNFGLYE